MIVDQRANRIALVNDPAPLGHGIKLLGGLLTVGGTLFSELVLGAAIGSVLLLLWTCRRHDFRGHNGFAGMAFFGLCVAAILRNSHTVAISYSPSRVQIQMYCMFAIAAGIAVSLLAPKFQQRLSKYRRGLRALPLVAALAAGLIVANSMQLTAEAVRKGQPVSAYSEVGPQAESLPSISDVVASRWIERVARQQHIQSDFYGQYSLGLYGYYDNSLYVPAIDPIITDDRSWILMTTTNVVLGRAAGGDNSVRGIFRTPISYFENQRPIIYASSENVVFGPSFSVP